MVIENKPETRIKILVNSKQLEEVKITDDRKYVSGS